MHIQLEAFTTKHTEWYQAVLDIRTEVFVHEQDVSKTLEFDGLDAEATHYIVLLNEKPIACARSRKTKEGIKLERFAVLKPFRGKLFGALILKYVLDDVLPANGLIYLNAQNTAIRFYKMHNFIEVGEHFTEANIDHVRMEYKTYT